jgi:hypothetical protein
MFKKAVLFVIIFTISALQAQTVASKYAGEFLAIGIGGRALGMGGAYTATGNDVTAAFYNPAGLAFMRYPQAALMHDSRYGNLVNYNYAGVAIPYGSDYTFGLTVTRLGVDGIPDTRNALVDRVTGNVVYDINSDAQIDPTKVTEFSDQDWAFYFSAAKKQSDKLYFGANIKFISRSIAEYSAFGLGLDVGAIYLPSENLKLGATIQDVTTTLVAWSTGRNELITPTLKIGGAYSYLLTQSISVVPALDFDIRFENRKFASQFNIGPVSFDPHAGLELGYKNVVFIRGGYNDVKQITVGAGIKLPKLNIDYSFARFSESADDRLPDTHRISITLTLEEPRFLRASE